MIQKRIDLTLTAIAVLAGLALSIPALLVGRAWGLSESAAERVSSGLLFGVFIGVYQVMRQRRR